jgi:glycerol-3-phosphate acyltransferase PlsY
MKIVLSALIAYVLGSASFSIVLSKLMYRKDVREEGSGNAGATNMARSFGKLAGALTLLGDVLKTVLAVVIGRSLAGDWGVVVSCLGCQIGHCFPAYHHFKGGKGVAVGLAITAMVDWRITVTVLVVFIITAVLSRKISLASILATFSAIPAAFLTVKDWRYLCMIILAASIIIFRHSENISRLMKGEEKDFHFGDEKKGK